MAELVDAQDSDSCGSNLVEVQVLFRAPRERAVAGYEADSPKTVCHRDS